MKLAKIRRNFLYKCSKCSKVVGICIIAAILLNIMFVFYGSRLSRPGRDTALLTLHNYHTNLTTTHHVTRRRVEVSAEEFRQGAKTGNSLIDDYGENDIRFAGEQGRGVVLTVNMKKQMDLIMETYRLNTLASDGIPLNRLVPDSRIDG